MRTSVLLSLALVCGPASAEWRQIVSGANSAAYADEDSIRRNGTIAAMRVLVDYPKPPFDGNNLPYKSLTMQGEYDCDGGRFRVMTITSHAANMGGGHRPYTTDEASDWEQLTETSTQRDLWKLACAKTALPKPKPAPPPVQGDDAAAIEPAAAR